MPMKSQQLWRCVNTACRHEMLLEASAKVPAGNPRCPCGSAMKKNYSPPVFQYLEFLYLEEPVFSRPYGNEE
jgi:hypothetical protein